MPPALTLLREGRVICGSPGGMLQQVALKGILPGGAVRALGAGIGLLASVSAHVHGEVSSLVSTIGAMGALEGFLSSVCSHVVNQVSGEVSGVSTVATLVGFDRRGHTLSEVGRPSTPCPTAHPVNTVRAGGRFFPIMATTTVGRGGVLQHEWCVRERVQQADNSCGSSLAGHLNVPAQPHL